MSVRTVKVGNVSLGASEQEIKEFFSFSGNIEYVEIQSGDEWTQVAYVTFKEPQGAETALLLSVLRSLPRSWEAKVTAIQKAKDLNKLSLEELLDSLMTHEMSILDQEEDIIGEKRVLTFKCSNKEGSLQSKECGADDEDISLITKAFKNFLKMKKKKRQKRKKAMMATWSDSDEFNSKEEEK